jgi:hypothetical protein
MKKIIKLTENDLTNLIKKIVKEQEKSSEDEFDAFAHHRMVGDFHDKEDKPYRGGVDFDQMKQFGPEEYDSFMDYINGCETAWCLKTKKFYDMYASHGPITVGKKFRK